MVSIPLPSFSLFSLFSLLLFTTFSFFLETLLLYKALFTECSLNITMMEQHISFSFFLFFQVVKGQRERTLINNLFSVPSSLFLFVSLVFLSFCVLFLSVFAGSFVSLPFFTFLCIKR